MAEQVLYDCVIYDVDYWYEWRKNQFANDHKDVGGYITYELVRNAGYWVSDAGKKTLNLCTLLTIGADKGAL